MTESLCGAVQAVGVELDALFDAQKADQMSAYMKRRFPFLGVQSKPRKQVQRRAIALAKTAEPEALFEAVGWCWDCEPRELQYVGMDLLRAAAPSLLPEHLPRVHTFIESKPWWDTVDSLAAHTVGTIVRNHPALLTEMDQWIHDDDMWVARSAILHQLAWKADAQPERLFAYTRQRGGDTEFFIRKALGWALRSLARVEPELVRQFVDEHRNQLSGLTIREATKHL